MPSDSTGKPSQSGQPRPRQVTMAVVLIVAGSVLGVLFAFQRISGLGSLEVRETYDDLVSQPPLAGTGVTADTFLEVIRVVSMVLGGAATAAAILGIYVLQRSRSARVALSFLAPVLFLGGLLVGDLVLVVTAVGVLMLWLHPVSDWYAGRPIPEPRTRPSLPGGGAPRRETTPAPDPAPSSSPPPAPEGSQEGPRPTPGFGRAPAAYDVRPVEPGGGVSEVPTPPAPRPAQVTVACILTWVGSGLALLVVLLSAVAALAAPDLLVDEVLREQPELEGQGVTAGLLQGTAVALVVVVGSWCVFAIVVAVLAMRRVRWARTALLVSAGVAALLCLVTTLVTLGAGAPVLIPLAMSLLTISLLIRPEVRAWYRAPRS